MIKATPSVLRKLLCTALIGAGACFAQNVSLTGRVAFVSNAKDSKPRDADKVVLWLTPILGAAPAATLAPQDPLYREFLEWRASRAKASGNR